MQDQVNATRKDVRPRRSLPGRDELNTHCVIPAWGHSRRSDCPTATSGLPRLEEIFRVGRHVSKVPSGRTTRTKQGHARAAVAIRLVQLRKR